MITTSSGGGLSVTTLALAKKFSKSYTDSVISGIAGGINYKGAVNYYSDLPANPEQNDSYTVLYMGTSGTDPDGTQYVWAEYEGTLQWVPYGINRSLLKTYQTFRSTWTTNGTILEFCDDVNADANTSEGMGYIGELRCSDLPFVGNADTLVEIIKGSGVSNKVIHIIITSGNVYPYRWEYTYWNNGLNVSGWIAFATTDTVQANPTLVGTESDLNGLQINGTKYKLSALPESLSNDEIDILWNDGYTITSTITNGTVQGANKILFTDVPITIIPNRGYDIPESVTVTNADYTYDEYTGVVTLSNAIGNVTITAVCEALPPVSDLDSTSWADIKKISNAGQGANYFAVGDCKAVTLNGTVGTLALNNVTEYVYIIGFDHNSAVEGTGISFGCFKTAGTNGIDVALCDSHFNSSSTNGSKWFNMNHSGNTNSGGWQGCDLRYDILGSVEAKNQQNATSAATSSPVANTLMAALPSDLRAVMKPITKYTDNVAGASSSASNVTATVDYLPLLAEYEVFGTTSQANSSERSYQAQYAYYVGSSASFRKKYSHTNTSSAVYWWERSAYFKSNFSFCLVSGNGSASHYDAQYSGGVAPAFLV